jgi:opine dehydrogenase
LYSKSWKIEMLKMGSRAKIAVLGSGNAGLTFAADLTLSGFKVSLYDIPRFEKNLMLIKEHGGIEIGGVCRTGFAKVDRVTSDIEEALQGAKVIIVAVPAYGHAAFAKVCSPYLEDGQIIVLNAGYTLGAVEFANAIIEEGKDVSKITIAETTSCVYATRMYLPNRVWCIAVKAKMPFSAFPAKKTMQILEILNQIYPQDDRERGIMIPAMNILETSLGNINPYLHVPMMILKAVDVELGEDPHLKSAESEACKELTNAMDKEGVALKKALGLKPLSFHHICNVLFYPPNLKIVDPIKNPAEVAEWVKPENQPGFYASGKGKNLLKMRFITEEIPYGLVGFSGLGDMLSVPTPVFDSLVTIASVITGTDFWSNGRTVEKLGIANLTKDELLKYLNEGII